MNKSLYILVKNLKIEVNGKVLETVGDKMIVKLKMGDKLKIVKNDKIDNEYEDLIVFKDGENLEIVYADGSTIAVDEFYTLKNVNLELPVGDSEVHLLSSNYLDTSNTASVVYAQGDINKFYTSFNSNDSFVTAMKEYSANSTIGLNAGAEVSDATTAEGSADGATAGGLSTMTMVGLGVLAVGGVAVAVGNSGGGSYTTETTTTSDTVAPTLISTTAYSVDKTVVLTYSEALDEINIPATTDFTVTTGGSANSVTGVVISGTTVTLTLQTAFA